jgi:predicted GIY-YIG superfamily endonuclease
MKIKHKKCIKKDCIESAFKCNTQKEFREKYPAEYRYSYKNNFMKECCSHMVITKKPHGYWTKEKCREEALKYNRRVDFQKYSRTANSVAVNNKWMNEICSHMELLKHNENYWTKEKCQELALKCKSRSEFGKKYYAAHKYSIKNNWLDEICSHMIQFNNYKRCIYAYEFSDNFVYIGLTYDLTNRHYRHMSSNKDNSSVYNYIKKTKLIPELKQLTNYLEITEAKLKEEYYVKKYKKEKWKILNKTKTGSLGGITILWTKEKCQEAALKCKTKSEFYIKYGSASGAALKNGWMNDICSHMENKTKPKGYWNYENCLNEAIKINNRKKLNSSGAYKSMIRNNWKDKIYLYMKWN